MSVVTTGVGSVSAPMVTWATMFIWTRSKTEVYPVYDKTERLFRLKATDFHHKRKGSRKYE